MLLCVNADGTHRKTWTSFPGENQERLPRNVLFFSYPLKDGEGVGQKDNSERMEDLKNMESLGNSKMLNVSEGLENRGMMWFGIVYCVQMKGSVHQAEKAKLSPIVNRSEEEGREEYHNCYYFNIIQPWGG